MYTGGYMGKILRINLADKTFKEEKLPEEVAEISSEGQDLGKISYRIHTRLVDALS